MYEILWIILMNIIYISHIQWAIFCKYGRLNCLFFDFFTQQNAGALVVGGLEVYGSEGVHDLL